jgi:hypothetical protein
MSDKPENGAAISRRECIAGAGAALVAASQPGLATEPRSGHKGHRRLAPAFRRVSLDK